MNSLEPQTPGESQPTSPPESAPPATKRALWGFGDLVLFLVFAVLALLLSQFVVATAYILLSHLTGWRLPPSRLESNAFLLLALQLMMDALLVGYVYFLIRVRYGQPFWATLRWRRLSLGRIAEFAIGGILLAVAVQLAPTLLPDKPTFPLQKMFTSPEAAYATALFAIGVAPVVEEVIFRGVLFAFCQRFGGAAFAVGVTALLFAALHISEYSGAWNHLLLILVVGVVFSLARGLTGSLAPSVVLHVAYNFTLMVGLFFSTGHFRTLPGVGFP